MRGFVTVVVCAVARVAFAQAPGAHKLAVGSHHACMITSQGSVACWGKNTSEQLGDGTREDRGAPVRVIAVADAVDIGAGMLHTCALGKDGSVRGWGGNPTGQTGDTMDEHHPPRLVRNLPPSTRLFVGPWSTCALGRDGKLRRWGRNPLIGK